MNVIRGQFFLFNVHYRLKADTHGRFYCTGQVFQLVWFGRAFTPLPAQANGSASGWPLPQALRAVIPQLHQASASDPKRTLVAHRIQAILARAR